MARHGSHRAPGGWRLAATAALTALLASEAFAGGTLVFGPDEADAATSAINDPAHRGRTIRLESGVFEISERWVLQPGMRVIGSSRYVDDDGDGVWDSTHPDGGETIIDGTGVELDGDRALIALGSNSIARVTVTGPAGATVLGRRTRDPDDPNRWLSARISDVQVLGAGGDAVRFDGSLFAGGLPSRITIERTIVENPGGSAGIFITNEPSPLAGKAGRIFARIASTRASSGTACLLVGQFPGEEEAGVGGSLSVISQGNVWERSAVGMTAVGGADRPSGPTGDVTGGRLDLVSLGDTFRANLAFNLAAAGIRLHAPRDHIVADNRADVVILGACFHDHALPFFPHIRAFAVAIAIPESGATALGNSLDLLVALSAFEDGNAMLEVGGEDESNIATIVGEPDRLNKTLGPDEPCRCGKGR